jgi:hypothetical protein
MAFARSQWSARLSSSVAAHLEKILRQTRLTVTSGEIQLLDGRLYVNHAGLLRIARMHHCAGIETEVLETLSRPEAARWVVKATVFKRSGARHGFVGWGDAEPDNVTTRVRGAELRIAETRAVNRALRKAYAVGICSAEEVGATSERELAPGVDAEAAARGSAAATMEPVDVPARGSVQDRLKLLIREHQLDPALVLDYGLQFLGIGQISDATPKQLELMASHLEQFAGANCTWLKGELVRCATSAAETLPRSLNGRRPALPLREEDVVFPKTTPDIKEAA